MKANEGNYCEPTQETLCWKCEWAAWKEGKCTWACSFTPVEGWKAKPTKTGSYVVSACPLFQMLYEIKRREKDKASVLKQIRISRYLSEEAKETILELFFLDGRSQKEIAVLTGLHRSTISRVITKKGEKNGGRKLGQTDG